MKLLSYLKKNKLIFFIALLFLFLKALTLSIYKIIWWDAAVYIGMGKYIYSLGQIGLWEYTRPIVWPFILGFFWKIGLDTVLVGRITEIAFSGLCILLTYAIAEKLFDRKTALLAALFLAISPIFFFFNGLMLTEIVSTFFALFGLYLFIDKKYIISGILFGTAFLTRFLQFLIFLSLFLVVLFYSNKKNIKNLLKVSIGFAILLLPYLVLNQILYSDSLFPFTQHVTITTNSGWHNYQPLKFYFFELFKENLLYLLSIFGIMLAFKNKDNNKKIIASAFLISFIFFNSIKQKEIRFLIILMPYMYILISLPLIYLLTKFRNNANRALVIILVALSLTYSANNIYLYYQKESAKTSPYAELENKFPDASGNIWISNPIIAVSSDKKISRLLYYPFFDKEGKNKIIQDADNADFVLLDLCDIGCRPNDTECEKEKSSLLSSLKLKLKIIHSSESDECSQYIFEK